MIENPIEIQIFYEISISIGTTLDINEMLKTSLKSYMKKLSCFSAIVYKIDDFNNKKYFNNILTIPKNVLKQIEKSKDYNFVSDFFDDKKLSGFLTKLPLVIKSENKRFYHIMELEDFGLLILGKHGNPFDINILKSLKPLNSKLAKASLACYQNMRLKETNIALKNAISKQSETEERRRELELRIQQTKKIESLGMLAGGIAHDFNNLLMGIMGNADLLSFKISNNKSAKLNIDRIIKSSKRAAELCMQLLFYAGKGKVQNEVFSLKNLIYEVTDLLEAVIPPNIKIEFKIDKDLPNIEGDPSQIRQIITNLITNASDSYYSKNGIINIKLKNKFFFDEFLPENCLGYKLPKGKYLVLEILDKGCGMDQLTIDKIFDPFFSTKNSGKGLGLASTLGIIKTHSGGLKVKSKPGVGTNFTIFLPASVNEICTKDKEHNLSNWNESGTVLIADDDEVVNCTVSSLLTELGYSVITAKNGKEAVYYFKENKNDIKFIILDMDMPIMNGEESFYEIKKLNKDIPIIISSGYNIKETIRRMNIDGLSGFIPKPYEINELKRIITEALK